MSTNQYLDRADIKDNIILNMDIQPYLEEGNDEIEDLAERLGVNVDDIETEPLHYKIKRYGLVYALKRFCQDKSGSNNVELPETEKYLIKYNLYEEELEKLRPMISRSMFTGDVDEIRDRAIMSGVLFRGG